MDELGEGGGGRLRTAPGKAREAREDGVRLLEADVGELTAVAGVPAQRRPPEPPRVLDEEEHDLERVGEADPVELSRGREGRRGATCVERAAEPSVGGTLRGHEQMFA